MNTNLTKGVIPMPGQGKPVGYECLDCNRKFIERKNLFFAFIRSAPKCPHCGSKNVIKTKELIVM